MLRVVSLSWRLHRSLSIYFLTTLRLGSKQGFYDDGECALEAISLR